ncbi:hypothetical protein Ddc_04920 [Ditylenchus destructor]|nr:hypothetical protein Ddc_04920 [Ditylenchus destructor]
MLVFGIFEVALCQVWSTWIFMVLTFFASTVTNDVSPSMNGQASQFSGVPISRATTDYHRWKRERAFDLLRIETESELNEENSRTEVSGRSQPSRQLSRRDEALNDERCQKRCNDRLRSGLDMVKAHSAFGSVGVPSVMDQLDLQMFCRLDAAHDRCLRDCGYEIQFNMRDYVCRDRYEEMVTNLPCYEKSAAQLKRHCGAKRCGPYAELEISLVGFGQRCRHLLCDLGCIQGVLLANCGRGAGTRATQFLIDYSRAQVSTWIKDMAKNMQQSISQIIPASCSRLYCDHFAAKNCTDSVVILQSSQGRI